MRKLILTCLFVVSSAVSISYAKPPENIALAREAIIRYHDSGEYHQDIKEVTDQALLYLQGYVKENKNPAKKPAIILDIDETSLSNYADMVKLNFGGSREEISKNENKGTDAPIKPTLELYKYAIQHDMSVIFLTGRKDNEKNSTIKNLKNVGFNKFDKIIFREGKNKNIPAAAYKTAMRKKLHQEGYEIILNIGDQDSDIQGGFAKKSFKLPNPFYVIA